MTNPADPIQQVKGEIDALDKEIRQAYERLHGTWKFGYGRLRISARVHSGHITAVFVAINLIAFISGVVMIFFSHPWIELGVSLVVGSLFSFGAFISQFWAVEIGNEERIADFIWRESAARQIGALLTQRDERQQQLDQLSAQSEISKH